MTPMDYLIRKDDSITRWWISPMGKRDFEAPVATFEAEINPGEGYVQIVYPVREKFLEEQPIRQAIPQPELCTQLYFPFENNRVDFTTFLHTPHYLWVHAKTLLLAEEAGDYPFTLFTCGGMKVWVNGSLITDFTPYTRNIAASLSVTLPLEKGENEIVVYADELAERDVFFYFELRYRGDAPLTSRLLVEEDPTELREAEQFLRSCYFPRDLFREGQLELWFDPDILTQPAELLIVDEKDAAGQKYNSKAMKSGGIPIQPGQDNAILGHLEEYPVGMFALLVCRQVGPHLLSRRMMTGTLPLEETSLPPDKSIQGRKEQALTFIARHGETVVNRAIAALELGEEITPEVYTWIDNSLKMVERHDDCADFYLPVLLLLLERYPHRVSQELSERIKTAVLRFRYWIDEPGNDVMWYFSENHALLFHIGQYLAGHLYPEDTFTASGYTGRQQYQRGRDRLIQWFDPFLRYGYGEWNSATYLPVDLIGFFLLDLLAPDEDIRALTRQGLDLTFRIMEYNSFHGVMASSFGRAYEETLKGYQLVEPNFITWITYGQGTFTSGSRAATLYCISSYLPPACYKEVQVGRKQWLTLEWDQGAAGVKTYSCRTNEYLMASARRYRPFAHGHQQHLMHVSLGSQAIPFYINHPGEPLFSGGNRPAYWSGNGTMPYIEQYRSLMVMVYRIDPGELVQQIHAYAPLYLYDEYRQEDNWFFVRVGDAYLGAWFSQGYELTGWGANTGKELLSPGPEHTILLRCGCREEHGSWKAFQQSLINGPLEVSSLSHLTFQDAAYGEVKLEGWERFTVAGKEVPYQHQPNPVLIKGCYADDRDG